MTHFIALFEFREKKSEATAGGAIACSIILGLRYSNNKIRFLRWLAALMAAMVGNRFVSCVLSRMG
jgi:hypothetical protein